MAAHRKLSDDMRARIRSERNTPCPCCGLLPPVDRLADKYGVSAGTISSVANRRG